MNAPEPTAEIISRYFDREPSPDNDEALAELLLTDPDAAAAFVSTARLDAILQRHLPQRRSPVIWKWITAGAAAALATAAAFALIPRNPSPTDANPVAGENWQPVETATVPRTGISAQAERTWDFYQRTDDESFVPLPDLEIKRWEFAGENDAETLSIEVSATLADDWKRKQTQAQRCSVEADGSIRLSGGLKCSIGSLMLASPAWPESHPPKEATLNALQGWYETTPVSFDHLGNVTPLTGKPLFPFFQSDKLTSQLEIELYTSLTPRMLGIQFFDAANHASLSRSLPREYARRSVRGLRMFSSAVFLPSAAPITIVLELGVPWPEQDLIIPLADGIAKNSTFEAKILRSIEGVWEDRSFSARLGPRNDITDQIVNLVATRSSEERKHPDKSKSCTFAVALPPGQEVEVSIRTANGVIPAILSSELKGGELFNLWSFEAPLSSVQALIVRPLQRHRVYFTVPLPRDPWNGLNKGITNALALRVPSIEAATDEAREAVSTLLGLDDSKPLLGKHQWTLTGGTELHNPTIRDILVEIGKLQGSKVEINTTDRLLRFKEFRSQ